MHRIIYIITLSLGLVMTHTSHAADQAKTTEYMLNNGLKVVVKEDHRAPVVISQIWYKVGSAFEPGGITGVSHALEHMMFKGTHKHPTGEFSEIISANGGQENAFTGTDYTAYYQKLSADKLPISFELEADRMHNLKFVTEEFAKEIKVVMEERRLRTDDDPHDLTFERFAAVAHISHPYQHPIIGWMDDLEHMTIKDLENWYKTWYAPNNATLVVVGDVKPEEVHRLAKQYYGNIPRSDVPHIKPQREPMSLGERNLTVHAPAKVPLLIMGYNTPSAKSTEVSWHPYALQVLAAVLDGGSSARLEKNIVRKQQLASSIDLDYDLFSHFSGLFLFSGTPAKGHTNDELRKAILAEIKNVQTDLVSDEELDKIKTQVVSNNIYSKDSIFYQAMIIGRLETIGLNWRDADEYVERIKAVTPQQIQEMAKLYLKPKGLTIANLVPEKM